MQQAEKDVLAVHAERQGGRGRERGGKGQENHCEDAAETGF